MMTLDGWHFIRILWVCFDTHFDPLFPHRRSPKRPHDRDQSKQSLIYTTITTLSLSHCLHHHSLLVKPQLMYPSEWCEGPPCRMAGHIRLGEATAYCTIFVTTSKAHKLCSMHKERLDVHLPNRYVLLTCMLILLQQFYANLQQLPKLWAVIT